MRRAQPLIELYCLNMISYFMLTLDVRATAQANLLWAYIFNFIIGLLSAIIVSRLAEAKTWALRFTYAFAGANGTVAGILLSKVILGH